MQHPQSTFPGDGAGTYPVELIVANSYGCTDTIVRQIVIDGVFSVYVPNAFTPDGDGFNDTFFPVVKDADPERYDFSVFDRWGTEVFRSTSMGAAWDGTVKGEEPKADVYTWRLHVKSAMGTEAKVLMGMVVLVR